MPLKKIIKTVKENHNKLKEKTEQEKLIKEKYKIQEEKFDDLNIKTSSKKGIDLKSDLFSENIEIKPERIKTYKVQKGDTLKSISKEIFNTEKKWISLHIKNIHKIPNPYRLIESMILDIPYDDEVNNFYDKTSNDGNYIIQEKDDIKIISKKIFGTETLVKKLIDWNYLRFTKDIYPSKEIKDLKYLDLKRQIQFLSKKYSIDINLSYKQFIIELIINISDKNDVPALVSLLVSNQDYHIFLLQENNDLLDKISPEKCLGYPMNLDSNIYLNEFPRLCMDIEYNIIFGTKKLKELRVINKNWPKAIVSYFMSQALGVGKPEEQKLKVKEVIKIIDSLLEKMNDKTFSSMLKNKTEFQNNKYITFDLLHKELLEYKTN
ncbi:MAG: LysM peptidoglycan-binding domain-containing protein [Candidatus Sericytochromatia bacterium]